jgi:2'-5' RNA ligase
MVTTEGEKKKRLFVAIGLPAALKEKLGELQAQLKRFARDDKWVRLESIHLTLKFLGYVAPEQIPSLQDAFLPVISKYSSFSVHVRGVGFFPNPRRPSVLWAGVEAQEIFPLQAAIEDATERLGFEKENRAFSPHLTLCRFRDPRGLLPLAQEVQKNTALDIGTFKAEEVTLYESILRRDGAQYVAMKKFVLGSGL